MKSVNVCFRLWPNDDVIAFIVDSTNQTTTNPELVLCYEPEDQYNHAHQDLIGELKPASPDECADLKAELESLGYVVNVVDDIRSKEDV